MKEEVTYEQAKEAKNILIKYIENELDRSCAPVNSEHYREHKEALVYLALRQQYFLD